VCPLKGHVTCPRANDGRNFYIGFIIIDVENIIILRWSYYLCVSFYIGYNITDVENIIILHWVSMNDGRNFYIGYIITNLKS